MIAFLVTIATVLCYQSLTAKDRCKRIKYMVAGWVAMSSAIWLALRNVQV